MRYDPGIHHRRSIRLREYDYCAAGAYFVTICAQGRECLFGEVLEGAVRLTLVGVAVSEVWKGLSERFSNIVLDEFVVMPNHVHGIVVINDVGAPLAAPRIVDAVRQGAARQGAARQGAASSAPTLGGIVRAFKSISAIAVNRLRDNPGVPVWQRNYYERIMRNDDELNRARKYIAENPMKWADDKENPDYVSGVTPA